MIHVVTEPAGATVRDETMELCSATPCDVTWKGDAAEPMRLHKVTIGKPGYRNETRTVKSSDGTIHVKLAKIPGAIVRPAVTNAPATSATVQPGFKDIPY